MHDEDKFYINHIDSVFKKNHFFRQEMLINCPVVKSDPLEKMKRKCEVCFVSDYLFYVICMLTCIQNEFLLNHVAKISFTSYQSNSVLYWTVVWPSANTLTL